MARLPRTHASSDWRRLIDDVLPRKKLDDDDVNADVAIRITAYQKSSCHSGLRPTAVVHVSDRPTTSAERKKTTRQALSFSGPGILTIVFA